MTEIRGFFPVNRKRKVLGTIPVTLNLKEGTMKVREDKMELKPIEKMTVRELKEELKQRSSDSRKEIYRMYLKYLRENDIGTENLKPPEPDWKRERVWPHEKPVCGANIYFKRWGDDRRWEEGYYFSWMDHPFTNGSGCYSGQVKYWKYATEPRAWKNVQRDGNPSEAGVYWVELYGSSDRPDRIDYWDGRNWRRFATELITHYCPIAPAPKFEEDE